MLAYRKHQKHARYLHVEPVVCSEALAHRSFRLVISLITYVSVMLHISPISDLVCYESVYFPYIVFRLTLFDSPTLVLLRQSTVI